MPPPRRSPPCGPRPAIRRRRSCVSQWRCTRRGRTLDGIRLGLEVRRRVRAWDLTLARVVYPFPYRELVTARAEELGLDPFLLAGIIRQESAFVPAIVSAAGAVGLMQVMPATGRELAGRIGPRGSVPRRSRRRS